MARALGIAIAIVFLVSGCTSLSPWPGASPSPAQLRSRLLAIEGVQTVVDSADPALRSGRPLDPGEVREVVVTLDAATEEATVLSAATSVLGATADLGRSRVGLESGDGGYDASADATVPPAWQVQLRPATSRTALGDVRDALRIVAGGGARVAISEHPLVEIDDIARFSAIRTAAARTAALSSGGTYRLSGEGADHLTIVQRPERTSADAIDALVAIARAHPGAEVLLQADWSRTPLPTVYVSHVSAEEQATIAAALAAPALADADLDGYPVPFVVSSSGLPDATGTLGGVPEP